MQNNAQAVDSLRWYAQMGVDLCVEDVPQEAVASRQSPVACEIVGVVPPSLRGRLGGGAVENEAPKDSRPLKPSHVNAEGLSSIANAVAEARKLADASTTLNELETSARIFNGCSLKKTASNTVFSQGVAASRLMFVGDAPSDEEDRSGVPFSGPSGQLLDKMLGFIGLSRTENFYITNCLFWRPPGNRLPSVDELEICRPLVEKHIALVNPKILVLVGGIATSAILKDTRGITRLRGQVFSYKNDYMADAVPVHVIYHPTYLLRQPLAKKQAWADLLSLKAALTA